VTNLLKTTHLSWLWSIDHCLLDLDGLQHCFNVLEELCDCCERLLLVDHLNILESYPLARVAKSTHSIQSLAGLHRARKGLGNNFCHHGLLASVVNASHRKLILSNDKFEWVLVQAQQNIEIGLVRHAYYLVSFSVGCHKRDQLLSEDVLTE
jgi:hypothetical protein